MLNELKLWPQKLKEGLDIAHNFHFAHSEAFPKTIKKIAFFGMGGSGITGRIIKTFFDKKSKVPVFVFESGEVPEFVDGETLAIAVSYSGNTWETVDAMKALASRFVPTIAITRGGRLSEIAEENNIPVILMPQAKTPRSSLGSSLGILLGLFDLLGLIDGKSILASFKKQAEVYVPKFENDKAYFDDFLKYIRGVDHFHIWGVAGDSAAFAYRAQTQFNENSKIQAVTSVFPELAHNLLVGLSRYEEKPKIVAFNTDFLNPNLEIATEATKELLKEKGVALYNPPILGDNWEEQLFHIILWSDFASYYLGEARKVDIVPVDMIEELKKKHKSKGIK